MRKLKDVRYIPHMTKNLISVEAMKVEGLRGAFGEAFSRCLTAHWLI